MILIADELGARIKYARGQLLIHDKDDNVLTKAELIHVEEVVLVGAVGISGPAIEAIVANGIDLYYIAYDGEPAARLVPDGSTYAELRLAQYRATNDDKQKLYYAKAFVGAKLANQKILLQRAFRTWHQEHSLEPLDRAIQQIDGAPDIATLMGIEGAAAQAYFTLIGHIVPPEWGFRGRKRRPPPDPVNAMLSFGYTYVGNLVTRAARAARLDIYLGLLHAEREGRPSLPLDLLEEFRPFTADATMLRIVRQKMLKPTDFETTPDGGCRMSEPARAEFIQTLENRLADEFTHPTKRQRCNFRQAMLIQARELAHSLLADKPTYQALVLR